jgi:hypothetical protein
MTIRERQFRYKSDGGTTMKINLYDTETGNLIRVIPVGDVEAKHMEGFAKRAEEVYSAYFKRPLFAEIEA